MENNYKEDDINTIIKNYGIIVIRKILDGLDPSGYLQCIGECFYQHKMPASEILSCINDMSEICKKYSKHTSNNVQ